MRIWNFSPQAVTSLLTALFLTSYAVKMSSNVINFEEIHI